MKLILVILLKAIYLLSTYDITAESAEEHTLRFEKFKFDRGVVRGGFNLSWCLIDYFTCLETIKPDVMCVRNKYYESVCTFMQLHCNEETGIQPMDWEQQALFESICYGYNAYT